MFLAHIQIEVTVMQRIQILASTLLYGQLYSSGLSHNQINQNNRRNPSNRLGHDTSDENGMFSTKRWSTSGATLGKVHDMQSLLSGISHT